MLAEYMILTPWINNRRASRTYLTHSVIIVLVWEKVQTKEGRIEDFFLKSKIVKSSLSLYRLYGDILYLVGLVAPGPRLCLH